MKYFTSFLFGLIFLMTNSDLSGQDSLNQNVIFPNGISFGYGIGSYANRDEYISKEKYSGSLPYFNAGWTNKHEKYLYQIGIGFQSSSDIKNYNVSTKVFQFSLNQGFLYPLSEFHLFSKKAYLFLGPSSEIFVFINKQNIAVTGFDYALSVASLISLGLNSEVIYPLSENSNIESSLNFSVLSLGLRMVDFEEDDESPVKLLTLFSGTNGLFRLGIRYFLLSNLSVRAAYLLGVTRISTWEPLHVASDNFVFTLTYGF